MGLRITYGCWNGSYSSFNWWRHEIAHAAGIPLKEMRGYSDTANPIEWTSIKADVLHILLTHSDSDGTISWQDCRALADRLEELLPLIPGQDELNWDAQTPTRRFIRGLRRAASVKRDIEFR